MKSKKKLIAILVSICLLLLGFAGATVAYFTDSEQVANKLVVGNISIELYESQYDYTAAGEEAQKTEGATAESVIKDSAKDYQKFLATAGENIVPGLQVQKNTYIENTGKNDAYVRFVIKVPFGLKDAVQLNFNGNGEFAEATAKEDVDGEEKFWVYTVVRNEVLAPGEMTSNALNTVQLKPEFTTEQLNDYIAAGYLTGEDRAFNILVRAEAIQSYGFQSADAAFTALDAKPATQE